MIKEGKNIVFGAYIYYVHIQTPVLMYEKTEVYKKPYGNKEFTMQVLLTEKDYKQMKKTYKGVKSLANIIEIDSAEEFETKYKVAPPYEAETYYMWKVTQIAHYSKDMSYNNAKIIVGSKTVDLAGKVDRIGNGSKANVEFTHKKWQGAGKSGWKLTLKAVAILELNELVRDDEVVDDEMDMGDVVDSTPAFNEEDGDTGDYQAPDSPDSDGDYPDGDDGTGDDVPF